MNQHNPHTFVIYDANTPNVTPLSLVQNFIRSEQPYLDNSHAEPFDNVAHTLFHGFEEFSSEARAAHMGASVYENLGIAEVSFVEFVEQLRAYMITGEFPSVEAQPPEGV